MSPRPNKCHHDAHEGAVEVCFARDILQYRTFRPPPNPPVSSVIQEQTGRIRLHFGHKRRRLGFRKADGLQ